VVRTGERRALVLRYDDWDRLFLYKTFDERLVADGRDSK